MKNWIDLFEIKKKLTVSVNLFVWTDVKIKSDDKSQARVKLLNTNFVYDFHMNWII